MGHSKSVPQRGAQLSCPCRCSNQSKLWKLYPYAPCRRPFPDKNIQFPVLHCRIQYFLHRCIKPMDFIYKQNVIFFKRCQNGCQITCFFQNRSGSNFKIHSHFSGNHSCKRCFTKPWRSIKKYMIHCLISHFCSFYKNIHFFF